MNFTVHSKDNMLFVNYTTQCRILIYGFYMNYVLWWIKLGCWMLMTY